MDVTACHACHVKRRWMSRLRGCDQVPRLPRETKVDVTPATQNEGGCDQVPRLTKMCVKDGAWQRCVWQMVLERWLLTKMCVTDVCVCERWCVAKMCVKDGVWQRCVWKMVVDKEVWQRCMWKMVCDKDVCERWWLKEMCVTDGVWQRCVCDRWWLKDGGWQRCVWQMVCDKGVCERWWLKDGGWKKGGSGGGPRRRRRRRTSGGIQNQKQKTTQRCGEKDDFLKHFLNGLLKGKLGAPKLRKSADKSLSQPWCSHSNAIYEIQLQKTIVLRMQPRHQATLTQPLQCDLQRLTCKTQQRRRQLQLQNRMDLDTPAKKWRFWSTF